MQKKIEDSIIELYYLLASIIFIKITSLLVLLAENILI